MTWIYEEPLPILVMSAVLCVALSVGFIKTGQKWLLFALAAVVVLTVALLAIERAVVTDREQVEDVLRQIAAAVERNDIDEAMQHFLRDPPAKLQADSDYLKKITFREVSIKPNLEIIIFPGTAPLRAETRFNVTVVADAGWGDGPRHYPRYVEATFIKQGDRWIVHDYQHFEPTRGMRSDR
jgi:hypothetical protein